jgi:hypothetical protein
VRFLNRKSWLRPALLAFCLGAVLLPTARAEEPAKVQRLTVSVAETAGIRRFGYPVHAILSLSQPVKDAEHFRLLEDGKPITAQFRPHGDDDQGFRAVNLDFTVNNAPLETREYIVEFGPGVERGPEPQAGMTVETTAEGFRVVHSSDLQFLVPLNLTGMLSQVKTSKTEYLRPDSFGLALRTKDETRIRAGSFMPDGGCPSGRVVKSGPLATTLHFRGLQPLGGNRSVKSVVEMEFPRSKSWVQVTWEVEDPSGFVTGLGADLNLNIQGEPTLVDLGAGSLVYAALKKGQTVALKSGAASTWETLLGPSGSLKPYVVAGRDAAKAEGWAHVMDRQRCTAAAIADFATAGQEGELAVDADGRLQLWKHFTPAGATPAPGAKKITFWLHFVGMPVHVGAATSPQAMLAPLQVNVRPRAE